MTNYITVKATFKIQTFLEWYNFQDSKFKFCFPMALTVIGTYVSAGEAQN